MRKIKTLFVVAMGLLVAACGSTTADLLASDTDASKDQKPNIIFILVDDLGFGDVGYNNSEIKTPTLDLIANSGMRLDRNYVYPICSPTRAALLTGQNPLRYGIDGPLSDDSSLPMDLKIMPEYFKDLGYQTFMIGKWHLGLGNTDYWPITRGFDYHYGFLSGWVDFYTHVYAQGLDWQRAGQTLQEEGHATDLLSNDAVDVIVNRDKDAPFFMYLSYNAPHSPLQHVPESSGLRNTDNPTNRSVYGEMVSHLDQGIEQVIDVLESQDILLDTIIVFSSDNGGSLRLGANNGDLSGGKGGASEGGLRVPGLIWAPGSIEGGKVYTEPTVITDWLPTLFEAAGGDPVTLKNQDGQSLWKALANDQAVKHKPFVLGARSNRAAYNWPWKLYQPNGEYPHSSENLQLFNVVEDPYEQTDLAVQEPEKLAGLLDILKSIPVVASKQDTIGRGAGSYYDRNEDGTYNYHHTIEPTRAPWADSATSGDNE